MNQEAQKDDLKFSPLVFVVKAVVATLKEYPLVNSSLDAANGKIILDPVIHIRHQCFPVMPDGTGIVTPAFSPQAQCCMSG